MYTALKLTGRKNAAAKCRPWIKIKQCAVNGQQRSTYMIEIQRSCGCGCSSVDGPKLVYSCSGSADVGELADQSARTLTRQGLGKMSCLAGIGGRMSGFVKSAEAASKVLAIDGCSLHCSRKTLEEAGITGSLHLCLEDIGFAKGSTEVNKESISKVVQQATILL